MQKSKYKNIYYSDKMCKWYGKITYKGTVYNLGCHETEREAVLAHDRFAIKYNLPTYILKKIEK